MDLAWRKYIWERQGKEILARSLPMEVLFAADTRVNVDMIFTLHLCMDLEESDLLVEVTPNGLLRLRAISTGHPTAITSKEFRTQCSDPKYTDIRPQLVLDTDPVVTLVASSFHLASVMESIAPLNQTAMQNPQWIRRFILNKSILLSEVMEFIRKAGSAKFTWEILAQTGGNDPKMVMNITSTIPPITPSPATTSRTPSTSSSLGVSAFYKPPNSHLTSQRKPRVDPLDSLLAASQHIQ